MTRTFRDAVASELDGNLLPFWRERSVAGDAFVAEMSADGVVRPDAPHGLILNSRLLWTFSALYRELGDEHDLEIARRAFDVLELRFKDRAHGGYHWLLATDGSPLDRSKKVYGQAFCVYALSEFHRATGHGAALAAAEEVAGLIDRHALDRDHGGYIEVLAEDWTDTDDLRLSDDDLDAPKSMNNHLHLLEAFTNYERVRPSEENRLRLYELVEIFGRHILEPDTDGARLRHFFDREWRTLSDSRTYGHDIEAAWLLCEAAGMLDDDHLRSRVDAWSVDLATSVLATGFNHDGGLAYEGRGGNVVNGDRDWWCQAEAVVGFRHVFELTGDERFARASAESWGFIRDHVVDGENGEWFWRIRADGSVDPTQPKVSEWKGPYHNVRMCLEMLRRLGEVS